MWRRDSVTLAVMEVTVSRMERVIFPFTDEARAGYPERGVEQAQRMSGHTESIGYLCDWVVVELDLALDRELVATLSRYHDLAKALLGDQARVPVKELGRPVGKLHARIKRLISTGRSLADRRKELDNALVALKPEFEDSPKLWQEVEEALTVYHLRPKRGKREAEFVWSMGQVMDAHFALWYVSEGRMKRTARNIRTFTDELDARLQHWAANLYWLVVKERYVDTLRRVYPNKEMALAQ